MSHITPNHSPAVEVVATLGDSVVGVRHVSDPSSGKTTTTTRAMLIGGAVAIGAGALAFFAATRIASTNHAELTAWVAAHKPAWSFRAEAVPTWLSVVSFLGFSFGLTALIAGLSRRRRELEPSTISIGCAAGVDFAVGGTTADKQTLVAPQGNLFVLDLTGMTGEITGPQGSTKIAPMATTLPVTEGMRVRAQLGPVGFHIAAVEAPRRQTTPLLAMLDRRTLGFFAASAAAHLALWAVARTVPPDASSIQMNALNDEELSMRLVNIEQEDATPDKPEVTDDGDVSGDDGKAAMILEQGTIGDLRDHSTDPAQRKIKNTQEDPELARREALEQARTAGVFGSAALQDGDLFASVVGTGLVSSGFDDADILGAIMGDGTGAPNGWGQNASGNGFGGGGNSYRIGGYNTIRDGSRTGEGWGIPGSHPCTSSTGVCRPHTPNPPVVIGRPDPTGDYDGSIIRRYVKRKVAQISYCYEQQLLVNKDLSGTVMAEWTISMNGLVQGSRASGVDSKVSSCIAEVISTIQFPKPPQVGVYQVRYPFVLHKTGS